MTERKTEARDEITELIDKTEFKKFKTDAKKFDFRDLMQIRVGKILIVCSLYDYYILTEDGYLQETIYNEFNELNLYSSPIIQRTYSGKTALEKIKKEDFDLVIATLRIGDMELDQFCKKAKKIDPELPVVILASRSKELAMLQKKGKLDYFDKVFIWRGDQTLFLAIIKFFEDKYNAPKDCLDFGIKAIVLVEDSPEYYSDYLPLLYSEIISQSQKLIVEGLNSAEKMLRQRARPKVLLAENYEEALELIKTYENSLLALITDLEFKRRGILDKKCGVKLIKEVRAKKPDLPVALQTSRSEFKETARKLKVSFIDKNSPALLTDLRQFIADNLGFGDFIFRLPNGAEVDRAKTIREFREKLNEIPEESLLYHSKNNHFSAWFIARTEFELANKIRPVHIGQFENPAALRKKLVDIIDEHLYKSQRGVIVPIASNKSYGEKAFLMIGDGSIGGKARGLAFFDRMMKDYINPRFSDDFEIYIPNSAIIGANVFSEFMESNRLYSIVSKDVSDEETVEAFMKAKMPDNIEKDLLDYLEINGGPIAARSSSLLEDAMYQPFAGVYATVMIPNSGEDKYLRLSNLLQAIKFVYASTFSKKAKYYREATGYRLEDEKMAIILQDMVGKRFDKYFYPHFSGVSRSFNYYPFGKAKAEDGVVYLALGLGKTIVEGEKCLQYSTKYPGIYPQFGTIKDYFSKSQDAFWAIDMDSTRPVFPPNENMHLAKLPISEAEKSGALKYIASTYSPENDAIYEGTNRNGPRIITFAPILKSKVIPFNDAIDLVTRISEAAINAPVEIEFAVKLGEETASPAKFGFLQVRPMVKSGEEFRLDLENLNEKDVLLKSEMALGNGEYKIDEILLVKPENFKASKTLEIAAQISKFNKKAKNEGTRYTLIGPGRWGSADRWLGIPVEFSDISRASVIVETQLPEMSVDPSQGSHFFQNLTSFKIAYITVKRFGDGYFIDWDWLAKQKAAEETEYVKRVKLSRPITAKIDGLSGKAIILKG